MAGFPKPYIWAPTNPKKYAGNYKNIVVRSSYEKKLYKYLDTNPNVISWASEENVIAYISPIDGRRHRYFLDGFAKIIGRDGKLHTYLIEVKPYKQTQPPKIRKRKTRQYITEVETWGINQAKWKAAEEYCADKGWEFIILNEYDLGIVTRPKSK